MQPTPGGSASGSGSGGGLSRGGLARFRSAPATWLEALLEDEEEDPLLKPTQCLTQLLTENADPSSHDDAGFHRQNSSPADFLVSSDGFYSNFAIPTSFDLPSSANMSVASPTAASGSSKRAREVETVRTFSGNLSSPIVSTGFE